MNLVEALRTGLPLRRPTARHTGSSKDGWLGHSFVVYMLTRCQIEFEYEANNLICEYDLLADDWEVKDETP